jgi:hypothetical protein
VGLRVGLFEPLEQPADLFLAQSASSVRDRNQEVKLASRRGT